MHQPAIQRGMILQHQYILLYVPEAVFRVTNAAWRDAYASCTNHTDLCKLYLAAQNLVTLVSVTENRVQSNQPLCLQCYIYWKQGRGTSARPLVRPPYV